MFKSKDLSGLVKDFQADVARRKQKIQAKISSLEKEAEELKTAIETETGRLVESELSDDAEGQEKANRNLRKLLLKQTEIQRILETYQSELNRGSHDNNMLEKVRVAASKMRQGRTDKRNSLEANKKEIIRKQEELKIELDQIDTEINKTGYNTERSAIVPLLEFIEPRVKLFNPVSTFYSFDRDQILDFWIDNNDQRIDAIIRERLTPKLERTSGMKITTTYPDGSVHVQGGR